MKSLELRPNVAGWAIEFGRNCTPGKSGKGKGAGCVARLQTGARELPIGVIVEIFGKVPPDPEFDPPLITMPRDASITTPGPLVVGVLLPPVGVLPPDVPPEVPPPEEPPPLAASLSVLLAVIVKVLPE